VTALFLSFLLLVYVVVPGILFRRIFNFFVPLRRFQWSRTEEITASVATTLVPLVLTLLAINYFHWFAHHPFGFEDSAVQKWSDYKDVLSASYSEKFFTENRQALLQAAERVGRRQFHFLAWFYLATICEGLVCGFSAINYGNSRVTRQLSRVIEKLIIPGISEWHAMFTPFTFPRSPKRIVQVDALAMDGNLYQGEVGDFHVDSDGRLTGFLMKKARRFLRSEYTNDRKAKNAGPKEKYWRTIPGESLYLLADKVSNLNFSYLPVGALDELAEGNLKKLKINASVAIQPANVTVEKFDEPKLVDETPQENKSGVENLEADKLEAEMRESASLRNFRICTHCVLNRRPAFLPRVTSQTPLVSRSDGRTYHIFLQFGPHPQPSAKGASIPGIYLAHFRFALDSLNIANDPVSVLIVDPNQKLLETVETVADKLATVLAQGKRPAAFYKYSEGTLRELAVRRGGTK
jgi:hypothetical protein